MEILSINFALFVVQLAFCILPIALGIRLFTLSPEKKRETREKLSKKLLGDSSLNRNKAFIILIYTIATISILMGLLVSFYIIFIVLPK